MVRTGVAASGGVGFVAGDVEDGAFDGDVCWVIRVRAWVEKHGLVSCLSRWELWVLFDGGKEGH